MKEHTIDWEALTDFGTLLTSPENLPQLSRAFGRDAEVNTIVNSLTGTDKSAILLSGASGVGKTAIVHEVAHRMAERGWALLEMTPADFMVGTRYLGEWQTRFKTLLDLVRRPRRIALYLPGFETLGSVGKASNSDDNLATVLVPYLSRGELAVIGEISADASDSSPALRRTMETITINPLTKSQTRDLAIQVAKAENTDLLPPTADRLLELAEYCGSDSEWPGRGLVFLRRCLLNRTKRGPVAEDELLHAVSAISGVPTLILDDRVPLNRQTVKSFFQSKVMGQTEAIDMAVDLTMMIKSGLTDPQKPMSSLLFVGPTGVGKTELARAIAEYCMGDANRLIRLDMSEYATREASLRLLGSDEHPGSLTGPVREKPFSIILLDEFEKANYAVFDMCLQLFDAGRLTDLNNRTVDFRRTVIILTSNLGSNVPTTAGMGFGGQRETPVSTKTRQNAERELERVFRPEFINRLDRIIHFVPLGRETLEAIARRELDRALDRTGIHRRGLNVQVDPAIIPVLLQKGYSPAYGARPLKRTIERSVLVPLARKIATGRLPAQSTVILELKGGNIRPRVLKLGDPAGDADEKPSAIFHQGTESAESLEDLARDAENLSQVMGRFDQRKSDLLAKINDHQTYSKDEHMSMFDEIYRLESIFNRYKKLQARIEHWTSTAKTSNSQSALYKSTEELGSLRLQQRILQAIADQPNQQHTSDVVLTIRLLETRGTRLHVVEKLARMYQAFLQRMDFPLTLLDDQTQEKPRVDQISFLVTGPGAYLALKQEQGLHVLRQTQAERSQREVDQVEVLTLDPSHDDDFLSECTVKTRRLKTSPGRLQKNTVEAILFHKPSQTSLTAVSTVPNPNVLTVLGPWLAALVQKQQETADSTQPPPPPKDTVVRRYELGPNALVRDTATRQRWGQTDRLFNGWLDRFVIPAITSQ